MLDCFDSNYLYLVLVERSRPRVPFGPDRGTGVPVGVVLEECLGLGVAASLHETKCAF